MAQPDFPNLTLLTHPLIQHKLTLLRDKRTPTKDFKQLAAEIAMLMAYEVTKDLPLEAVELGGGGVATQRCGERPAPAGHDPVHVGDREAQAVADLPHGGCCLEEPLELVAERDGEARREVRAVARVELARGVPHAGLEAGAGGRREGAGGRDVGDEGDVGGCHFTSIYQILT